MGLTRPKLAQVTTTTASFNDPVVVINANAGNSDNNVKDIGIVFERGGDLNKVFLWDESTDEFVLASSTEQGETSGDVVISSYSNLHINSLTASNISSVTVNNAYTLPTVDGNDGYVLQTDGSGTVSWAAAGSSMSGHTIQNAGLDLNTRTNLNFDGTYLVASDNAGSDQTNVTIGSNIVTTTGTQTLDNKTIEGGTY